MKVKLILTFCVILMFFVIVNKNDNSFFDSAKNNINESKPYQQNKTDGYTFFKTSNTLSGSSSKKEENLNISKSKTLNKDDDILIDNLQENDNIIDEIEFGKYHSFLKISEISFLSAAKKSEKRLTINELLELANGGDSDTFTPLANEIIDEHSDLELNENQVNDIANVAAIISQEENLALEFERELEKELLNTNS